MDDLSNIFGAISHPARRAIVARLASGPACVTEIAAPFNMSLNAVSKHLKVLEGAGLIHREKHGRDHVMELRAEPLRQVSTWLDHYERFWGEHLDRVEGHFNQKRRKRL